MPRVTAAEKADGLLLAGHVAIVEVAAMSVRALVRGDGAIHTVTFDVDGWRCSCPNPARRADCSHARAVRRVVAVDLEEQVS